MLAKSAIRQVLAVILIIALISLLTACSQSVPAENGNMVKADQEQLAKMELLNRTADEMYKKTMDGQILAARGKLQEISDQITRIRFDGVTSIEGLNALTETITQAKRVFNAAAYSPDEGRIAVAKIRLATDALTHSNQPMWLQYHKVLQEDMDRFENDVKTARLQEMRASYGKLAQHYGIIRPSLMISRTPSEVEKIDSLLSFIQTSLRSDPVPINHVESGIGHLRLALDELFAKKKETTAYLPINDPQQPLLWTLLIAAIIISVLTFSAWRMFKGGRDVVPVKHKEQG